MSALLFLIGLTLGVAASALALGLLIIWKVRQ